MNTPIVEFEGDQLEIDFDIDRPEFSICPSCASQIIKLADGCGVCGWSENQLNEDKQRSHSVESSISIPCLIKQPKQPDLKGLIQKDLGDRFIVEVSDELITVSKLFVYPDFSKSVGQIDKCSSKTIPPSKNCSSKRRRHKGEGSGHIYYRTVTRNGKEYQQAYYQWRSDGQQRTKYIPKKLLDKVKEAEHFKKPVAEILELLLGGLEKCSSKKFDTFSNKEVLTKSENSKTINSCSSKITSPPSKRKKRRSSGYGGGYIENRFVKRNHKTYSQYWYHYEFWLRGDRILKKSRYIPRRSLARVEKLEGSKAPVEEILKVLMNKSKK